jgi:hypothetical protein
MELRWVVIAFDVLLSANPLGGNDVSQTGCLLRYQTFHCASREVFGGQRIKLSSFAIRRQCLLSRRSHVARNRGADLCRVLVWLYTDRRPV